MDQIVAPPLVEHQRIGVSTRRWYVVVLVSVALIAVAHTLDVWAWTHVRDAKIYERDYGRMLRSAGYLPTWIIVAIGLYLHDRPAPGWKWRGSLMLFTPVITGALAEVLKLVVRRQRPGDLSPEYVFRAFSDGPWSNRGLGMPSSHTTVAFGAATILARLFPRAWWLWYLVAAGCAYTRVLAGAHYLSDVIAAAIISYIAADLIYHWSQKRRAQ